MRWRNNWRQTATTLAAVAFVVSTLLGASITRWELFAWVGTAVIWCWSSMTTDRKPR